MRARYGTITHTILAMVKARGCVSINDIAEELLKKYGYDKRTILRNIIWSLIRRGKLVRAERGVYCDPDYAKNR